MQCHMLCRVLGADLHIYLEGSGGRGVVRVRVCLENRYAVMTTHTRDYEAVFSLARACVHVNFFYEEPVTFDPERQYYY